MYGEGSRESVVVEGVGMLVHRSFGVGKCDIVVPRFAMYPGLFQHGSRVSVRSIGSDGDEADSLVLEVMLNPSMDVDITFLDESCVKKELERFGVEKGVLYPIVYEKQFIIVRCAHMSPFTANRVGKLTELKLVFSKAGYSMIQRSIETDVDIFDAFIEGIRSCSRVRAFGEGILIQGSMGSGKSNIVKHMHGTFQCPDFVLDCRLLCKISFQEFDDFIGDCKLLEECVLLVDGLEALLGDAAKSGKLILNTLLEIIQSENSFIRVIATTQNAAGLGNGWSNYCKLFLIPSLTLEHRRSIFLFYLEDIITKSPSFNLPQTFDQDTMGFNIVHLQRLSKAFRIFVNNLSIDESFLKAIQFANVPKNVSDPMDRKLRWEHIGGYAKTKKRVRNILKQWENPNSLTSSRGMLLYGPSGCGKSLFANVIESQVSMGFLRIDMSSIYSKYFGESESNLRAAFISASDRSPCILFFDNFDVMGRSRMPDSDDTGEAVQKRMLSTLLNELDGISPMRRVYLLAATRNIDDLDNALIRPGRIDQLIHIGYPPQTEYKSILNTCLEVMNMEESCDIDELVALMQNYTSCAHFAQIAQECGMNAVRRIIKSKGKGGGIRQEDIDLVITNLKAI